MNEFKVRKGLIVQGSGSTILDIQGSQGQLFSVTDSLSGSLFSVNDISGVPIMEVFSDNRVNLGTFNAEAIKVSGSFATMTGSLFGTSSWADNATSASFVTGSNVFGPFGSNSIISASFAVSSSRAVSASFATTASFVPNTFLQNGNSFGTTATLGTNDNQSLQFETNNTTRMFISSSGEIGIGTTTPTRELDVEGNLRVGFGTIDFSNTNNQIYLATSLGLGNLYFKTNASDRMIINSAGNIGIGTTAPESNVPLTVNTDNNAFNSTLILQNSNTGTGALSQIQMRTQNTLARPLNIQQFGNDGTGQIINQATSSLQLGTSGSVRLTITSGGNVGIGLTSPGYPLEVSGSVGGTSIYASNDIVAFSDQSVKTNIRPIENVLKRIGDSRGVLYDRTDSENKDNIGFIAQELEQTFPELVVTNEDGTKAVKYQNATAVLFEAIKEQQKQINELKELINGITS